MLRNLLAPAILGLLPCLATASAAQDDGSFIEPFELEGFASTEAKSMNDYLGRTVLIEFFAYW